MGKAGEPGRGECSSVDDGFEPLGVGLGQLGAEVFDEYTMRAAFGWGVFSGCVLGLQRVMSKVHVATVGRLLFSQTAKRLTGLRP